MAAAGLSPASKIRDSIVCPRMPYACPSFSQTYVLPIPCATGEFRKFLRQAVQAGQDLRILRSTNPGDERYSAGRGGPREEIGWYTRCIPVAVGGREEEPWYSTRATDGGSHLNLDG